MLWNYEKCQKYEWEGDWAKNLLAQAILEKIFGTKWSDSVKLDRKRKVWYQFLRVF